MSITATISWMLLKVTFLRSLLPKYAPAIAAINKVGSFAESHITWTKTVHIIHKHVIVCSKPLEEVRGFCINTFRIYPMISWLVTFINFIGDRM